MQLRWKLGVFHYHQTSTQTGKVEKWEFWISDCCPNNHCSIFLLNVQILYFVTEYKVRDTHIWVCYVLLTALDICCISLVSQNTQSSGQKAYTYYLNKEPPHTFQEAHVCTQIRLQLPRGRPLLDKGYTTLHKASLARMKETKDFFSSVSSISHLERNLLPSYFLPGGFVYRQFNNINITAPVTI